MQFRQLGNTDLKVSLICLGAMTWGEQNNQTEAFAQMDMAIDAGINFFDSAEMYPVPPKSETYTATETIIGKWFASKRNRDNVILASKVASRADWLPYIRDGNICLDITLFERFTRYSNELGAITTQSYVNIAKKYGLDPAQMALAYVNSRSFLTSNIIGATSLEQLQTNINSINVTLSAEILEEIESVHTLHPNPCP